MAMRWLTPSLLVASVVTMAGQAHAQTVTATDALAKFEEICVDTGGDRQRALGVMESNGWVVAPDTRLPPQSAGLASVEFRVGSAPDQLWIGFVGVQAGSPGWPVCVVSLAPTVDGMGEGAVAWAGGAPMRAGPGQQLFVFRTDRGDRQVSTDISNAEIEALARSSQVFLIGVQSDAHIATLMRTDPTF